MTVLVFVDTGVLLQAVDDKAPGKRDQARDWLSACWQRRCGRVSMQVLSDFYVSACKRFTGPSAGGDARAEIRRYQYWRPGVIDQPTVDAAWAVESRYRLGYWDALVVASAQQQGCALLITEDLPHDLQIDGVRIVNPFTLGPELLDTFA